MPVVITGNNTPTAGGVVYGDGTTYANTAAGMSGQLLQSNGASAPSWVTASGDTTNFQEFTTTGTWTKPASCTFVMVEVWGAGGGGGGGRRGATGSHRGGASAAGGGAYRYKLFKASDLTATVTATVGAGGTAGAGATTNDTDGSNGVNGGNSTFGSYLTGYGGSKGRFGRNSNVNGGRGGGVLEAGNESSGGAPYLASTGIKAQAFGGG